MAVLPFDNVLEVVALSGSEVRRLFDYIASIPLGNGAFAQVSREVRVVYDSGRVRTLTIAGRPIEDDKMYYMGLCCGRERWLLGWIGKYYREGKYLPLSIGCADRIYSDEGKNNPPGGWSDQIYRLEESGSWAEPGFCPAFNIWFMKCPYSSSVISSSKRIFFFFTG